LKHLRPLLTTLLLISLPLVALSWVSNIPKSTPEISQAIRNLGFESVDGVQLEQRLAKDPTLQFGGKPAVIACPKVLLTAKDKPGLCGYCKPGDFKVYPRWFDGFSTPIQVADFDYRHFYEDSLHKRFVMLTNGSQDLFSEQAANGWRESLGRWFTCRNDDELDVNAYVEVYSDDGKIDYKVGTYDALGLVREQGYASR
jgi:hypothetical protein